jgi:hypothetical protein
LPSKAGRGGNGKKKRRGSNSSSSSTKAMSISHLHPPGKGSTGRVRCKHCQVKPHTHTKNDSPITGINEKIASGHLSAGRELPRCL